MIQVENLTRSYGEFIAVNDVSFTIKRGEIVGLLGHNGAGKTTIMKTMTGFLEPTAGRILLKGEDVSANLRQAQSLIGYLPENCPLWLDMTVLEYLEYQAVLHGVPNKKRTHAILRAVQRAELKEKADDVIQTLSRGYRQRVGVAQAILHEPDVVILDEPTNGLDPSQILHMRSLIHTLAENATVFISTHILQEVQATCERVLILRAGTLALDARLEDLQKQTDSIRLVASGDVKAALRKMNGIRQVIQLDAIDPTHYHLLASGDLAPQIARRLSEHDIQLYALHPMQRTLETVFAEVNESIDTRNKESH